MYQWDPDKSHDENLKRQTDHCLDAIHREAIDYLDSRRDISSFPYGLHLLAKNIIERFVNGDYSEHISDCLTSFLESDSKGSSFICSGFQHIPIYRN